jgi:putative transposase
LRKSFKYRIYPNKAQTEALIYQLREACDLYNCALDERIGAYRICRKSITYYDQASQLKPMRAEGLIGVANFSCCQDILRRLDKTFKAFFGRIKRGGRPGFPRFKSSRRYDSLTFPSYGDGCGLDGRLVRIQGVGEIKVKLHRPVEGKIKTVAIKREAGRWFAIFSVKCSIFPLPVSSATIGIDMGLTAFVTLSDGTEIDNPRLRRDAQRRLRVAQRTVARRKNKRSNRRRKAVAALQKQHAHIQNKRSDFQHKVSRILVNSYGVIAVEDLNIKGLASGMLAKSVNDAGWGYFLSKLAYKAESAGREFIKVDPRNTSQTCICGQRVAKTLSERWHSCPGCGLSQSRDHVSAQVILRLGLSLRSSTWPDVGACVLREAVCFS